MNVTPKNKTESKVPNTPIEDVNSVVLQGEIIHKYVQPKVVIITMRVRNAKAGADYPKVVFFGDLINEAAKFNTNDRVKVVGNIQSSKKNPRIKNQKIVNIFANSICKAPTQIEEAFGREGYYVESINQFKLIGTVVHIDYPEKAPATITLKCLANGHISFIPVIFFPVGNLASLLKKFSPSEKVIVIGSVQTAKKVTKSGEPQYFEDYVAYDIQPFKADK